MKIRHYSYSNSGGAGNIANRLANTQSSFGYDSKLIFKISGNLKTSYKEDLVGSALAIADKFVIANRNNTSLFTALRSKKNGSFNFENADI